MDTTLRPATDSGWQRVNACGPLATAAMAGAAAPGGPPRKPPSHYAAALAYDGSPLLPMDVVTLDARFAGPARAMPGPHPRCALHNARGRIDASICLRSISRP